MWKAFVKVPETAFTIEGPVGPLQAVLMSVAAAEPRGVAVICHPHPQMGGTLNNKVVHTVARACRDQQIASVRFNFRGVGESAGTFDEARGEQEDLLSVMRWVSATYPHTPLYLAGFSFGSFIAFQGLYAGLAEELAVTQLLCIAPPVERMAFAEQGPAPRPLWVIQGEADEVISAAAVYRWCEQQQPQAQLVRVPDCSHFFHQKLPELKRAVTDWLVVC